MLLQKLDKSNRGIVKECLINDLWCYFKWHMNTGPAFKRPNIILRQLIWFNINTVNDDHEDYHENIFEDWFRQDYVIDN